MEFDRFSAGFLTTRSDAPARSELEDDAIQDAHMAYLAALHESGDLLAAGPTADGHYRGMLLFRADVETASALMASDPAVEAGWFDVRLIAWMVPAGAMHFTPTTFPRSMAEAD